MTARTIECCSAFLEDFLVEAAETFERGGRCILWRDSAWLLMS